MLHVNECITGSLALIMQSRLSNDYMPPPFPRSRWSPHMCMCVHMLGYIVGEWLYLNSSAVDSRNQNAHLVPRRHSHPEGRDANIQSGKRCVCACVGMAESVVMGTQNREIIHHTTQTQRSWLWFASQTTSAKTNQHSFRRWIYALRFKYGRMGGHLWSLWSCWTMWWGTRRSKSHIRTPQFTRRSADQIIQKWDRRSNMRLTQIPNCGHTLAKCNKKKSYYGIYVGIHIQKA